MWKYIVTWYIMFFSEVPCPDNIPGCLVYHAQLDSTMKQEVVFYNRDSAFMVYNSFKTKNDKSNLSIEEMLLKDKVRIDSVHIDVIIWKKGVANVYTKWDSVRYRYK